MTGNPARASPWWVIRFNSQIFLIYGVFAALGVVQIVVLYVEQFGFNQTQLAVASWVTWVLVELAIVILDMISSKFLRRQAGHNLIWTEETAIRHKFLFQNFVYILGRGLQFSMLSWSIVSRANEHFLSLSLVLIWFGLKVLRHIARLVRFYAAVKHTTQAELTGPRKFFAKLFLYTKWMGAYERQFGPAAAVVQAAIDFLFLSRMSTIGVILSVFDLLFSYIWIKVSAKRQHLQEPPGWPFVLIHDLFVVLNFSVLMIYSAIETPGWLVISFLFILFVLIFKIPGPWSAINITLAFGVASHIVLFVLYSVDDRNPQPYFKGGIDDNIIFIGQFVVWLFSVLALVLVSTVPKLRKGLLKIVEDKKAELEQLERAHSDKIKALSASEGEEQEENEDEEEESISSSSSRPHKGSAKKADRAKDRKLQESESSSNYNSS